MNKHFCEKERKEDGKKEVGNSLLSLRDEFRGDTRGLDGDVKKKRKERKGQRSRISEMFPCPMNPPQPCGNFFSTVPPPSTITTTTFISPKPKLRNQIGVRSQKCPYITPHSLTLHCSNTGNI